MITNKAYSEAVEEISRLESLNMQLLEENQRLKNAGQSRVFVIPMHVAELINNAFLPLNPNKLRVAHPDVVAAAKIYKEALQAASERITAAEVKP